MTANTPLKATSNRAEATPRAAQALDNSPANLTQLAEMLGKRHRLPKQVAQRMLADAFALIEIGTLAHGRFVVRGFGMWRISLAAPRIGRNPKQGTTVALAARAQMKFAHGKDRRESFSEVGLRLAKARDAKTASTLNEKGRE